MNSDLCPLCLAANVIATPTGPTCTHRSHGPWFPEWWATADETRRVAWLRSLRQPAQLSSP